jgi:DNA polymerase III subunit chi
MDILFYHLEKRPLEAVLPGLLEKTLARGLKAYVKCGSDERLKAIDDVLWSYRDDSFLPHGTTQEERPNEQHILLGCDNQHQDNAAYFFVVGGATMPETNEASSLERLIVMFDGTDPDALDLARQSWKDLRGGPHALTYWQQNEQGQWEKKG